MSEYVFREMFLVDKWLQRILELVQSKYCVYICWWMMGDHIVALNRRGVLQMQ